MWTYSGTGSLLWDVQQSTNNAAAWVMSKCGRDLTLISIAWRLPHTHGYDKINQKLRATMPHLLFRDVRDAAKRAVEADF